MIDVRDDDRFVVMLREFYEKKKRVPTHRELRAKDGLTDRATLYTHFQAYSIDEIYEAVLGVVQPIRFISEFIQTKSGGCTKSEIYVKSREIARNTGLERAKISAIIRMHLQTEQPIAGYMFTIAGGWGGTGRKYRLIKVD